MRKNLLRLGKIALTAGIVVVIFRYFFHFENLDAVLVKLSQTPLYIYFFALLAAALNWSLETLKWKQLLRNLESLNFFTAFKSTCAGAAVSNILPFRIGEYLGRIVYVKPENHVPAIFNSVLGSSAQFLVSLTIGIPALFLMLDPEYHYLSWYATATVILIVISFAALFIYFKQKKGIGKYAWLNKLADDIKQFTFQQILLITGISILRYLVFATFYSFLFIWFGVAPDLPFAFAGVATVYLIQSFAPSVILTDAGLRTALPLLVFRASPASEAGILAAALINYGFNILLPSLTGLCFIIVKKVRSG